MNAHKSFSVGLSFDYTLKIKSTPFGAYLVPNQSSSPVLLAFIENSALTTFLSRVLRHANLIHAVCDLEVQGAQH